MSPNRSKADHNFEVAAENYLKAIWNLSNCSLSQKVTGAELARHLGVKPPSVCNMLAKLKRLELIFPQKGSAILTQKGQRRVAKIIRKHQLIEMFLEKTLKLNPTELHADAELLEHAISENLLSKIDKYLGHPKNDINGVPIPNAGDTSVFPKKADPTLSRDTPARNYLVTSIADFIPEGFLAIQKMGIKKGSKIELVPSKNQIKLKLGAKKQIHCLDFEVAQLIRVRKI